MRSHHPPSTDPRRAGILAGGAVSSSGPARRPSALSPISAHSVIIDFTSIPSQERQPVIPKRGAIAVGLTAMALVLLISFKTPSDAVTPATDAAPVAGTAGSGSVATGSSGGASSSGSSGSGSSGSTGSAGTG